MMTGGKRAIEPLTRGRVRLRLLEEGDLPLTLEWRNQDDIRKWFFHSNLITPDQHKAWYEQYRTRDDDFVFVIEETQSLCRPVGQLSIYHVDWAARRAEFGRLMIGDPEARGQGLAMLATGLLVDHALGPLGLQELYLELLSNNSAALAVYEACGFEVAFQREGVLEMKKLSPLAAGRR
jgi:diamine N-acetyltransferase